MIWISVDAEIKARIVKLYMNRLQSSAFLLLKCVSQAFVKSGFLFFSLLVATVFSKEKEKCWMGKAETSSYAVS